jgi:diguanylate cyclase (GGDEF)-like protein
MARMALDATSCWRSFAQYLSGEVMLRFARALGFMAPLMVALCVTVVVVLLTGVADRERSVLIGLVALSGLAGMTTMALLAWSYVGWRLNRLAQALETTMDAETPPLLKEAGIPAERRLARAFNTAAGTFLQIAARATHDRLTGIINRETLLGELVAEVERANRYRKPLSVAFIDIDRFKPINDTYGHNSGDAVLRQVANRIADNIRGTDVFGRYGGEEFMLILPETTPDEAIILAEQLRALVMQEELVIAGDQRLQVTISVGIAGGRGPQLHVDALVDQADAAMYAAKSLGRNRTYLYRDVDEEAPVRKAPISAESRAAAAAIGQWASDTATEALASVLAPQPHHRGRPSDMIASLATGMALQLGLPEEEIERVRIASLLHDLGKLAVPAEILDKPSTLTDGEWQAIGEHPRIGQVILEQASSLREAIPVILHHHERFNGGGYPHGLKGNEIPLGARIVAVADAYHAMVHERPYSEAKTHEEALDELRRHAGTQFDPAIVRIFCQIYSEGVPPDGLEEVYRLHERARGGLDRLNPGLEQALEEALEAAAPVAARRKARRSVRRAVG